MNAASPIDPLKAAVLEQLRPLVDSSQHLLRENDRLKRRVLELEAGRPAASKRIEWAASVLTAIGALLLATAVHPAWGFAAFLASNGFWICFAGQGRLYGMLAMQLLLTVTSLIGLWNWWLSPIVQSMPLLWSVLTSGWTWFGLFMVCACAALIALMQAAKTTDDDERTVSQ